MSVLVDDIVVSPNEALPEGIEASLSAAGLSIKAADFGESKKTGTLVRTSVGVVMVDREPETRTVTLKLIVREDADVTLPEAASRLEAIVGELQERDNWIRRDFHVGGDFGSILYHVSGEVSLSDFAGWQVGDSPDVTLTMVCDFAGYSTEEVEAGPFTSNPGERQLVYALPASDGTTKGLKRIRATNEGDEDWRGLIWAEECRDYKPGDPTAEPVYQAVALTPKGGAAVIVPASPEVRAVGTVASGTGPISPGLPAGTQPGDLLIMVAESGGATAGAEANTALTAVGWDSPPPPYADQKKGNTRLTLLYRIATGTDPTTTNDTGDHQIARIIGVKAETFDTANPFNAVALGTQGFTKSVSIPGGTTTRDKCLVIAFASGSLPDASTTTEFGAPTNASLSELTERIDNSTSDGDGGAIYAATGVKAAKGAYSATTCTAAFFGERGVASLAINAPGYVEHAALTAGRLAILGSEIVGVGHMTHRGPRKVVVRIEQPTGAVGDVKVQVLWRPLGSSRWVEDNPIVSPYVVGDWCLLDLDVCRPQEATVGDERWELMLVAWAPGGSGSLRVLDVYPLPTEQYLECSEPYEPPVADAQSAKSPETMSGESELAPGPPWSTPNNAKANDGSFASVELHEPLGSERSDHLVATNHKFAIPEGATILGCVCEAECSVSGGSASQDVRADQVQLVKGGAAIGEDRGNAAIWATTERYIAFGSSSDLWGMTLTPADVNDSTFGWRLSVWANHPNSRVARVDHMRLTVYYTLAEGEDRVCFATRSIELASDGVQRQHRTDDVWGSVTPDGFLPYDSAGGLEAKPSRGIVIATQGDINELPDVGVNPLSLVVMRREGHGYARQG